MKISKYIILALFLFNIQKIIADENSSFEKSVSKMFISTNVIAPFSAINPKADNFDSQFNALLYKTITGISTNFEIGFNLNFGYKFVKEQLFEVRLSTGYADPVYYLNQIHFGYFFNYKNTDWYFGPSIKLWDVGNTFTTIHFYHIIPYVSAGYMFQLKSYFFLDLRLSQSLAIFSWSSLSNSKPNTELFFSHIPTLIDFHPCISLSFGYNF